jgi:hypothetical protein
VWPRGAQVRRTAGVSEVPDSSKKTMQARRRRAFLLDPGPVTAHPAGDRVLVGFDRAAGWALHGPAELAQQAPHVPGMVADPGQPPDHRGDPGQGPQVGIVAVGSGALEQGLFDAAELGAGQLGLAAGPAGGSQRLRPAGSPAPVPDVDALPGDAEGTADLGLRGTPVEQLAGAKPPPLHAGEVSARSTRPP